MASTNSNGGSFRGLEVFTLSCPCSVDGNDCTEPACKRYKLNVIDPLEISPKSISNAYNADGTPKTAPILKNQKRARSDATLDDSELFVSKKDAPPARRSSSCVNHPSDPNQQEMFRPRATYPANFQARVFESQIGFNQLNRSAEQRTMSVDWTRPRADSDLFSPSRSYSVGNLSELTPRRHSGPGAYSTYGSYSNYHSNYHSRLRSRTASSDTCQSDMSADLERISLAGSPRPSPLPPVAPPAAVFTPISLHKSLLPALQSTAEVENETEEEEEAELIETLCGVELSRLSESEPSPQAVVAEEGGEDGRVTVPESFLPPSLDDLAALEGRLSPNEMLGHEQETEVDAACIFSIDV